MTTTYRDDPRWQAAQREYIDDKRPGEDAGQALLRRTRAVVAMHDIQVAVEAGGHHAWILDAGECTMGDHEIVEVVIGTAEQANERARQLNTERKTADAVTAWAVPLYRP